MASLEADLISSVLVTGDILTPLDYGITTSNFRQPANRQVWKWIITGWKNSKGDSKTVPSQKRLLRTFPNFDISNPEDSLEELCLELIQLKARSEVEAIVREAVDRLEEPGADCLDIVLGMQQKAEVFTSSLNTMSIVSVSRGTESLKEDYLITESASGVTGIPWPWDVLNRDTMGMHGGEFLLVYGRPKNMKTWVACYIASQAYWENHYSVLFYTREMKPTVIQRRVCSLIAGVPYKGLIRGRLSQKQKTRYFDALDHIENAEEEVLAHLGKRKFFIITSDRESTSGGGVMGLRANIQKYRPDLVVVDGVYMLRTSANARTVKWDNLAEVCADLKDLSLDFNVPILGTTQENRESEGKKRKSLSGISFADAFGMWCDMACNVSKQRGQDGTNELRLVFPGTRETDIEGFVIGGNPSTDFGFRRVLEERSEESDNDSGGRMIQ